MEIDITSNECCFSQLKNGDAFLYHGVVHIKSIYADHNIDGIATRLSDGLVRSINPGEYICPVNAKVVFKIDWSNRNE